MDTLGQWVYDLAEKALSLLPDSPFIFLKTLGGNPLAEYLGWVNWFVPISVFIAILEAWCTAILVYYVIQIMLRWARAIE